MATSADQVTRTSFSAALHRRPAASSRRTTLPESTAPLQYLRENPVDPESLKPYLFWNAQHYTRNLIDKTDLYELLAICWEVGMGSSIHNHQGQNCWMAAPIGRLAVQNFRLLSEDLAAHRCNIVPTNVVEITPANPVAVDPLNPVHDVRNSARMGTARREPAHLFTPVRLLHCVFGGARQLRRDWTELHVDVRRSC